MKAVKTNRKKNFEKQVTYKESDQDLEIIAVVCPNQGHHKGAKYKIGVYLYGCDNPHCSLKIKEKWIHHPNIGPNICLSGYNETEFNENSIEMAVLAFLWILQNPNWGDPNSSMTQDTYEDDIQTSIKKHGQLANSE